jgi:hypothetical protein
MPVDTQYNRRLAEILQNYNEINARVNQPTNMATELRVGGTRPRNYILQEGHNASWNGADMYVDYSLPMAMRTEYSDSVEGDPRRIIGGVSRRKKAGIWTDYSVDTIEKGLGLASKAKNMFGGVSRRKKAGKWTDYSVDTIEKGMGLASKAKNMFGGVSRRKKAGKWTDYSVDTIEKGLGLAKKAQNMFGGAVPRPRVKKAMKVIHEALGKKLGGRMAGAGSPEMAAKMERLRNMRGKAKKAVEVFEPEIGMVRKAVKKMGAGRPLKGSPEMKAKMAAIRAMRK